MYNLLYCEPRTNGTLQEDWQVVESFAEKSDDYYECMAVNWAEPTTLPAGELRVKSVGEIIRTRTAKYQIKEVMRDTQEYKCKQMTKMGSQFTVNTYWHLPF